MKKNNTKTGGKSSEIDELYRPVLIHSSTYLILSEHILTLVPPKRNVILGMNEYDMREINPVHPVNSEAPTHLIIFCIRLITDDLFQPIGGLLIYRQCDQSAILADCLKTYINDLWKLGLHVVATVSPAFKIFKDIIRHLVNVEDFDSYSGIITYGVYPIREIIHIYDIQFLLVKLQNLFKDGHLLFKIGGDTDERILEASWNDMATVFNHYQEFKVLTSFLDENDSGSRRVHIFTEQIYNSFVEALFLEILSPKAEGCEVFLSCVRSFLNFTEADNVDLDRNNFDGYWNDLIEVLKTLTFQKSRNWTCTKENPSQEESDLNSSTRRKIDFSDEEEAPMYAKEPEIIDDIIKRKSKRKKGKRKRNVDIKRDPKIMCKISLVDNSKCLAKLEEMCTLEKTRSTEEVTESQLNIQSDDELLDIADEAAYRIIEKNKNYANKMRSCIPGEKSLRAPIYKDTEFNVSDELLYESVPKETCQIAKEEKTKKGAKRKQSGSSSGKKSKSPRAVISEDSKTRQTPKEKKTKKHAKTEQSASSSGSISPRAVKLQDSEFVVSDTHEISLDPDPKEIYEIPKEEKTKKHAKKEQSTSSSGSISPRAVILQDSDTYEISYDPDPKEIYEIPEEEKTRIYARIEQPSTSSGITTKSLDIFYEECHPGTSGTGYKTDPKESCQNPEKDETTNYVRLEQLFKLLKEKARAHIYFEDCQDGTSGTGNETGPKGSCQFEEEEKRKHFAIYDQPSTSSGITKRTECQAGTSGAGNKTGPKGSCQFEEEEKRKHFSIYDQPSTSSGITKRTECQAGTSGAGNKTEPKGSCQFEEEEKRKHFSIYDQPSTSSGITKRTECQAGTSGAGNNTVPKGSCQFEEEEKRKHFAIYDQPSTSSGITKRTECQAGTSGTGNNTVPKGSCQFEEEEKRKHFSIFDQPSTSSGITKRTECQAGTSGAGNKTEPKGSCQFEEEEKRKHFSIFDQPSTSSGITKRTECQAGTSGAGKETGPKGSCQFEEEEKRKHFAIYDQPSTSSGITKRTECQAGTSGTGNNTVPKGSCQFEEEEKRKHFSIFDQPSTSSGITKRTECQAGTSGAGNKTEPKDSCQFEEEEKRKHFAIYDQPSTSSGIITNTECDASCVIISEMDKFGHYAKLEQLFMLLEEKARSMSVSYEGYEVQVSEEEKVESYVKIKKLYSLFEGETDLPRLMLLHDTDIYILNRLLDFDDEDKCLEGFQDSDEVIDFDTEPNTEGETKIRKSHLPVKRKLSPIAEDEPVEEEIEASMDNSRREIPNILDLLEKEFQRLNLPPRSPQIAFEKNSVTCDMICTILGMNRLMHLLRSRRMRIIRPGSFIIEPIDYFVRLIQERNALQNVRYYGHTYHFMNPMLAYATLENDKGLLLVKKD